MQTYLNFLRSKFTEKQIYVRSKGTVSYVSLSSGSQITLATMAILFCGWVGYASVRSIFSDEIASVETREMKAQISAYQDKLNNLQASYDSLNGKLALTKDWFDENTSRLEARHKALTSMLERHSVSHQQINEMQARFADTTNRTRRTSGNTILTASIKKPSSSTLESRLNRGMNKATEKALTAIEDKAANQIARVNPIPLLPDDVYERVVNLNIRQKDLIDAIEENTDRTLMEYESVLAGTKVLDVDSFVAQITPETMNAVGGPYIPFKSSTKLGSDLDRQIYRISNNLDRLDQLSAAVTSVPLARPIHNYRQTSGFGPRLDPIRKRPAFHSGADFGTPSGTPVHATLGGVVTFSGNRGPYGLVVEIDHGNGFKTRYAHLKRTRVRRGQTVNFQDQIGDSGNSGRSTGPHLHYEIWYQGRVRDPETFLQSGKQIFSVSKTLGTN